jgi:Domain of unknown function (DUF4258)
MLRYSDHARKRMHKRKVSEDEVERVCDHPDTTYPDTSGNRCFVREIDGRSIRVVRKGADPDFIITVIVQGED